MLECHRIILQVLLHIFYLRAVDRIIFQPRQGGSTVAKLLLVGEGQIVEGGIHGECGRILGLLL